MSAVVVHTTGINITAFLANAAAITVIVGGISAILIRSIKRTVRDMVSDVIDVKVGPRLDKIESNQDQLATHLAQHDTRIATLEGVNEGRRQAVAAAAVTVKSPGDAS